MFKKRIYLMVIAVLAFANISAQNTTSFTTTKTGKGNQNIIMICVYGCSSKVWDETVNSLSANATCYTLNFSGFAGNTPQAEPSVPLWEKDIVDFIKKNKIDKPVLIGHSLGGTMALDLASKEPGLFSKIIVVDAFPCLPALSNTAFKATDPINYSVYTDLFEKMTNDQFYNMQKAGILQMLSDTSKLSMVLDWSVRSDRRTLGKVLGYFMNTDLRVRLSAITCPSLILLQPNFKNTQDMVKQQYSSLKFAQFQYATKGLHFMMYDDKEWYLNSLRSFLK